MSSFPGIGGGSKITRRSDPFAVPRDTHAFFLNLEFRY